MAPAKPAASALRLTIRMTLMNLTEDQIERIVQEVIRRLTSAGHTIGVRSATELAVDDRVISLAKIEGRLSGVSQLVVRKKAVVTPSVKDELRQKNIEIVRRG